MSDSIIAAVAGGLGGAVSMTLTYPLIVLSTRSAVRAKKSNASTLESAMEILKKEGLAGLYAGLDSSIAGIVVTNTVFYLFLEESKRIILGRSGNKNTSTAQMMLASTIAGAATTITTNPIWLIQTHQATRGVVEQDPAQGERKVVKKKPGMLQAAREIIGEKGITALWRGIGPALVLVINPVLQYTAFERLVQIYRRYQTKKTGVKTPLRDIDVFWLGAIAKAIATGGTYPYIVVKSRLQAATHQYGSSVQAILQILREEGLSGLYAGIGTKLLQSVLTASFLFVAQRRIFELVKLLIASRMARAAKAVA